MRRMDGHKLLSDLVRIPSVNPREQDAAAEAEIAAFTADWLSRAGLQVEVQPVLPGRPNVVARLPGRDRSRTLLLECHMDTVETGGMTGDPFSGRSEAAACTDGAPATRKPHWRR